MTETVILVGIAIVAWTVIRKAKTFKAGLAIALAFMVLIGLVVGS